MRERRVAAELGASCQIPLAVYCEFNEKLQTFNLRAKIAMPDGDKLCHSEHSGHNPDDIFEFIETEKNNFQGNVLDFNSEFFADKSLRSAREEFERAYLKYQINKFGGNVSKTASYVGMERSALHRKMKLLNIESTLKEK